MSEHLKMTTNSNLLLPRWVLTVFYLIAIGMLVYFVIGASKGEIILASRSTAAVATGEFLWPMCLFPLGLLGFVAIRHDPKVRLDPRKRVALSAVFMVIGLAGVGAAYALNH